MDIEKGPWTTGYSWTSPMNYFEEVRKGFSLPKEVRFHDATLRDGEQTPGVVLRKEDKFALAKLLDEVGVDRIEAGMPAVSEEDFEAIKAIAKLGLKARIMGFCRAVRNDIDLNIKAGTWGVILETPAGYLRIRNQFRWTEEEAIKRSLDGIRYAKSQGQYVVFFPYDATRADINFLERMLKTVYKEARPDAVAIVDTTGCITPPAMSWLTKFYKSIMKDLPIEVHTHNDLGLATANELAAVAAGAEVVHVCVNGLGERCGNAALDELAVDLQLLYGYKLNINFSKLEELALLAEKLTGVPIPRSKAVTGTYAFGREVGLGMDMIKAAPLTVFPYLPEYVGQKPTVILGKKSGVLSIKFKLEQMGLEASEDQIKLMLDDVKNLAIKNKGPVSDSEFMVIYLQRVGK